MRKQKTKRANMVREREGPNTAEEPKERIER